MVLVDGSAPDAVLDPVRSPFRKSFSKRSSYAPLAARLGLMSAVAPWYADPIGLPDQPKAEKRRAFVSVRRNRFAAAEIRSWSDSSAAEAVAAGPLDPALPVSVITAGPSRAGRSEPAQRSLHGYFENVPGSRPQHHHGPRLC